MKAFSSHHEGGSQPPAYERLTDGDRAVILAGMRGVDVSVWIAYQLVKNMQPPQPEMHPTQEQQVTSLGAEAVYGVATEAERMLSMIGYTASVDPEGLDLAA